MPLQNAAKTRKMTETLAHGYSSESTQQELSIEYQHDMVEMNTKKFCILEFWTKVALALEGLRGVFSYRGDQVGPGSTV